MNALAEYLAGFEAPMGILAGAGVSMDAPAGLPSAKGLMRRAIRQQMGHLIPDAELEHILERTSSFPTRPGEFLRFEIAMYGLDEATRLSMLSALQCGGPNPNHYALAQLLRAGHLVVTTNFDVHIETAYRRLYQQDCRVAIREADFVAESAEASRGILWKIHGCLSDRSTLAATFTALMADNSNRMRWFRRALEECDLVVVGYSGSDDLDLIPPLARTISEKRLLWVDHAEGDMEWLTPRDWLAQSPVRMHVDCVGLERILFSCHSTSNATRREGRAKVVRAPTREVLKQLLRQVGLSPVHAEGSTEADSPEPLRTSATPIDVFTAAANALALLQYRRGSDKERMLGRVRREMVRHGVKGSPEQKLALLVELFNSEATRMELREMEADGVSWEGVAANEPSAFLAQLDELEPQLPEEELILAHRLRGCLWTDENPSEAQRHFERSLAVARSLGLLTAELSTLATYSDLLYPSYFPIFWHEQQPFPHGDRLRELVSSTGYLPLLGQQNLVRNIDYVQKLQVFDPHFVDESCSVGFMDVFRDALDLRRIAIDLGDVRGEMESTFVLAELSLTAALHFDRVPYSSPWIEWQRLRLLAEALGTPHAFGDRLTEMTSLPPPEGEITPEELKESMFSLPVLHT